MEMIKNLFQSDLARRLAKNASMLLGSDAISSVFRLIAYGLTARALGADMFGMLIIVQTYVGVIDRLVNFQSWQAVIKFGSAAKEKGDREGLKSVLKFCFTLDVFTAFLGGLLAVGFVPLLAHIFEWTDEIAYLSYVYALSVFLNIVGTPIGLLRLFDRFDLLSYQRVLSATFKLVVVAVLFFLKGSLFHFALAWMGTSIVEYLILFAMSWKVLRMQTLSDFFKSPLIPTIKKNMKMISFAVSTNLHGALRMSSREFDTLIVGKLLDPAAAGLYKVAKMFSVVLLKISDPLYEVIYPELAKLWAKGNRVKFVNLIRKSGLFVGSLVLPIWICFVFFGKTILFLTVGPSFVEGHSVLVGYMFAILIAVYGLALLPAILAIGRPQVILLVELISTICYFIGIIVFSNFYGLTGVGLAYILYYIIWISLMIMFLIRFLSQSKPDTSVVKTVVVE